MTGDRESGVALIFALIVLVAVAGMVAVVASSLQPRITSHEHLERTVRLTALADAAVAGTLAELAADRFDQGLAERALGEGTVSSTVTRVGQHEVEVVVLASVRGWRATVVARVDVQHGPRVLRWNRYLSPQ